MKKVMILSLVLFAMPGFSQENIRMPLNDSPGDSLKKNPGQQVLIINSFDPMSIKARNNKRDLFRELTDSLVVYLAQEIEKQAGDKPVIIPGILHKANNLDSLVFKLIKEHNAYRAILVWSVDIGFEEAGSKEETDDDGKPRTITSYNLCANNEYTLYSNDKILKQSTIESCEFFTTRSVRGRFTIRFGPDIVGKRKHTYRSVAYNANRYILEISAL